MKNNFQIYDHLYHISISLCKKRRNRFKKCYLIRQNYQNKRKLTIKYINLLLNFKNIF